MNRFRLGRSGAAVLQRDRRGAPRREREVMGSAATLVSADELPGACDGVALRCRFFPGQDVELPQGHARAGPTGPALQGKFRRLRTRGANRVKTIDMGAWP